MSAVQTVAGMPAGEVDPREPGGEAREQYLAAHNGREFTGGAVCWDPRVKCEGVCRVCPREGQVAS
jgi:hypothetical protein